MFGSSEPSEHYALVGAMAELFDKLKELRSILQSIFEWLRRRVGTPIAVLLIVVMIVLIGGVCAWWNWETLEKAPGVSSIVKSIERRSVSAARGGHLSLAVAHLEYDKEEEEEKVLLDELRRFEGAEIMRVDRVVSWPEADNEEAAAAKAGEEARHLLQRTGADVLLWGSVITLDKRRAMRLYWTTAQEFPGLKHTERYETETIAIPALFWDDLKQVLGLMAQSRIAALTQGGHYSGDKLAPLIADVRKLLQSKQGVWGAETESGVRFAFARALAEIGGGWGYADLLQEGIDNYRRVLTTWTRERVPLQWASTQINLGNALRILAELGDEESAIALFQKAVAAFRAALDELTRERAPLLWATAQNDLGTALAALAERESGENRAARLQEAVAAFRAALEELTREQAPILWAIAQNNLGGPLMRLGERESGESGLARLQEAVAAFRAALEELTREQAPILWAKVQMNLSVALTSLGRRESGESGLALLQEAVVASSDALKELTRERVSHDWAMAQGNLGGTLMRLGERESGESGLALLQKAVAAFDAALSVFVAEGDTHHAKLARKNRGTAAAILAARRRAQ
jgi:tetratricopeptide (TPR) repeat protein